MIKRINALLLTLIILIPTYYLMNEGMWILIWAYIAMLTGLFCARWFKSLVILCSAIAVFNAVKILGDNIYPHIAVLISILFFAVIPIPYYFSIKTKKDTLELEQENKIIKKKYSDVFNKLIYSDKNKKENEEIFNQIMQLYIMGRDLSRNMFFDDYAESILKVLKNRPGIISVGIFNRKNGKWLPLAFSNPLEQTKWESYINSIDNEEINYSSLKNPEFVSEKYSTIIWPIKLKKDLLGCIIIICEKEYEERYVHEGLIFSSQIALVTKRVKLFNEINEKSRNDGLTGLYLKRYFMERLTYEIQREKRYLGGFYILMLDIDFFKQVNDKYGHLVGDKVLFSVAKTITDCVRPGDIVGRYGGEEFIIFMPMAADDKVLEVAKNIKNGVESKKYIENSEEFNVTISIGIAKYPQEASTVDGIINAADKALYKAKQAGRNKIIYK